jgi:hypothetical protein
MGYETKSVARQQTRSFQILTTRSGEKDYRPSLTLSGTRQKDRGFKVGFLNDEFGLPIMAIPRAWAFARFDDGGTFQEDSLCQVHFIS